MTEGETVGQNIIAFDDTLLEKGTMLMLQVAVDKWALERNVLPLDEGLVNSYRKNKGWPKSLNKNTVPTTKLNNFSEKQRTIHK